MWTTGGDSEGTVRSLRSARSAGRAYPHLFQLDWARPRRSATFVRRTFSLRRYEEGMRACERGGDAKLIQYGSIVMSLK